MLWATVKKCVPMEWAAVSEDARGITYEAEGGYVRVSKGVVVSWRAPR